MRFLDQEEKQEEKGLNPIWWRFIHFCQRLGYGEIAKVKIQDKLPVSAEVVREKVKFEKSNKG